MIADLFDSLLSMTVAGSLALISVWMARLPVRRWFGAQIAYASWIVVPLVVIATLLPAPLASFKTVMTFARHTVTPSSAVIALQSSVDLRPALLLVWSAGVLAMLAWLTRQQRSYLRSLGPLHASKDASARIVQSGSLAGGPALVGALRPRIVLPADFASRYTPRERELILAHEHAHLARGDARINALVAAVRCLNWFNPLVHFASATFRFDQELACDAAVISRFPEARRPYADAMLKTQLIGQSRQELRLPVGCPWPSGHPLKERIVMLKHPLPTRAQRAIGAVFVAVFCASGGYLAWASQPARAAVMSASAAQGVDVRLNLIGIDQSDAHVEVTADAVRVPSPVTSKSQSAIEDGTLFVGFGRPLRIAYGNPGDRRVVTMTAQPHDDDTIETRFALTHEDQLVSKPFLVVRDNVPARMTIGADRSGNNAAFDGFDLAFTVARASGPTGIRAELTDPGDVRATPSIETDTSEAPSTNESAKASELAENAATLTKPAGYGRLKAFKYPAAALASKATFVVYVTAQVDASGKVGATHAETENTTVPLPADIKAAFIDTAVAGVKSWTFDPATNGGTAVASEVVVPIIFTMESAQPAPLQRSGTLDAIVISAADSSADGGTPAKASLLP